MGSYGIGISRLVGAIIEYSHDESGIVWPLEVAPFQIGLVNVKSNDEKAKKVADEIYQSLSSQNIDILYDDKSDNAGVKFSRMDLIGLPFQVIVGNKAISDNLVEVKNRKTGETSEIKIDNISDRIKELIF
jgi:prolyl-tRNA synthetase